MAKQTVSRPTGATAKKSSCLPLLLILAVLGFLVFGRSLGMMGITTFDVIHYLKPPMSDAEIDRLINPTDAKGYTYPKPSETALNRVLDCSSLYAMREFPRSNPLCLNLFRTNANELEVSMNQGSYDRIVLYGERSVFDAPAKMDGDANYLRDLYNSVRFMDQIALPNFLSAYGLSDVSYVKDTRPYPYLFYRLSSIGESDSVCHNPGSTEQVQGCSRGYFASIIPVSAIGPQLSDARPVLRKTDNKRFSYLSHYPKDCYSNMIFAHETAHMLNRAGQSETKATVMESWFNEQVAGLFSIYGADLACGPGTVTRQKNAQGADVVGELVEFNAHFAPAALSHSYPESSTCKQALLTQWYLYLTDGDYRDNFRTFFTRQRAESPSIADDSAFARFILKQDPQSSVRNFLASKGCSF